MKMNTDENKRILENECMRITVADAGAELISVFDKALARERIWTADPTIWNRHAPILFPFVGKVTDGKYRIGGAEYTMKTQHGFARDLEFACREQTDDTVTHCLEATEETRTVYPFDFRLAVRHSLVAGRPWQLRVEWNIENAGCAPMPFCIGGHPGFLMPEGVKKEDCWLVFDGQEELRYIGADSAGFAIPQTEHRLSLEHGAARYREDIPDTWIFEDHQVQSVGIAGPDRKPFVRLHCEEFPMLAVWANKNGPFICLEPWFGRTDDEGFTGTVDRKKDIVILLPNESKKITYIIDFRP